MGYEGDKFTWSNRQFERNFIRERLDRILATNSWRIEFSATVAKHLEDTGSDHRPLLLSSGMEERREKRRFRFQESWCENEEVINLIKRSWKVDIQGSLMYKLVGKLKHCRHKIVEWQRTSSSNSQTNIHHLKDQLV
ncbi:uncharacterized protein LOC107483195 [Arachis duranensis]|uniref:Uncharacterized protein LOC107483195 n=1 Tax=Arachis duranensis TaxID=130453 RepID=A0A6P4CYD0_ARADU|nr:uncharacterized protein LOC107483195 [Arachis duranensis]